MAPEDIFFCTCRHHHRDHEKTGVCWLCGCNDFQPADIDAATREDHARSSSPAGAPG